MKNILKIATFLLLGSTSLANADMPNDFVRAMEDYLKDHPNVHKTLNITGNYAKKAGSWCFDQAVDKGDKAGRFLWKKTKGGSKVAGKWLWKKTKDNAPKVKDFLSRKLRAAGGKISRKMGQVSDNLKRKISRDFWMAKLNRRKKSFFGFAKKHPEMAIFIVQTIFKDLNDRAEFVAALCEANKNEIEKAGFVNRNTTLYNFLMNPEAKDYDDRRYYTPKLPSLKVNKKGSFKDLMRNQIREMRN